ncbi:MAG TPA: LamG-like jellyroll fold domain-containing protein, partial [Polyangiaceae bacterium]
MHPNFLSNGYVYALYTVDYHHLSKFGTPEYSPATDEYFHDTVARIVRYQARAAGGFTSIDEGTRTVLMGSTFGNGCPIISQGHGTGSLLFGQDGTLLISCGDSASYGKADFGGPDVLSSNTAVADGIIRPEEDVGAFRAQLVDSYAGKVLRVDPMTGKGLPSNPFFDPSAPDAPRSKVWALGLRNAYRMTLRPESGSHSADQGNPGTIYLGDVGWNAVEELDVVKRPGQNFGWPLFEGLVPEPEYAAGVALNRDTPNPLFGTTPSNAAPCTAQYLNFNDLLKQDARPAPIFKNPCDPTQPLPASIPTFVHSRPALEWHHESDATRVPIYDASGNAAEEAIGVSVTGQPVKGFCSVGGVWYEGDDFPPEYKGTYFHADYVGGWLKNFVFDANDKLVAVRDFIPQWEASSIVSLATHPTKGGLYFVGYENSVRRIRYVGTGNQPPTAVFSAIPLSGSSPLQVQFSASGSHDPESTPLTYSWDFGDGSPVSTETNPTHIFNASGIASYTVTLTVTDAGGLMGTTSKTVVLNSTPPRLSFLSPFDGDLFTPGLQPVSVVPADDEQSLDQLQCSVKVILHHNQHVHPEPAVNGCVQSVALSALPCEEDVYYYEISGTVSDGTGLQTSQSIFAYPDCAPIELLPNATAEPAGAIHYSWQTVLGADQYELEISDSVASPAVTLQLSGSACDNARCQTTVAEGIASGSVSFRVRAHNPFKGWREWSNVATFVNSGNTGPVVQAGSAFSATAGDVIELPGIATDDGLPTPPGALTTSWSLAKGPQAVSWPQADQTSLHAHVVFPAPGIYTLRLTASDGMFSSSAEVTATVTGGRVLCESNALSFDGQGDWLNIPDVALPDDFTIETWVKLDPEIDEKDGLVGLDPEGELEADINFYGGTVRLFTGEADAVVAHTPAVPGVWQHYALTRSNGLLTLYINGVQDAVGNWNGTFRAGSIGHGNAGYFGGQLEEFRIWNVARSAAEISAWYAKKVIPTSAGLLAYYDFNEQPANQAVVNMVASTLSATLGAAIGVGPDDPMRVASTVPANLSSECGPQVNQAPQVSAGLDGTATVGAAFPITGSIVDDGLPTPSLLDAGWTLVTGPGTPSFAAGEQTSASTHVTLPVAGTYVLRLTASDGILSSFDEVTITAQDRGAIVCISEALNFDGANDWLNIPDLSLAGDFTIEAWAKLAPGIDQLDGLVGQEAMTGPDLNFYAGHLRLYTGAADAVIAETVTTANVWTHYAVTRQSGALTLFINGVEDATGNWTGPFPVRAIGRGAAGFLGGQLDEVRIWNVARDEAQIADSYQTKVAPASSGLLAYYVFNEAPNYQSVLNAVSSAPGATLGANATAATDDPTRLASTAPVNFSTDCGPPVNQAPQVNAGPDGTAIVGVARAINGSISDDGLPTPAALTAAWTLLSGPDAPSFAAGEESSALTHVLLPMAGTYVLRLTASDGALSSSDDVTITALPPPVNQAPQVNAGPDVTAIVGVARALNGSISDDGLPTPAALMAAWTLISGPGTPSFAAGEQSSALTHLTFSEAGTYVLRLTASDGALSSFDELTITASVAVNLPPQVSAGPDGTATVGVARAINGSIIDDGLPTPAGVTAGCTLVSGPGTPSVAAG